MNNKNLSHTLSSLIPPHLLPEALGNLMLVNKQLYQTLEQDKFWRQAVLVYFQKKFQHYNNSPDTNWLTVFGQGYQRAYQGLPVMIRETFAAIKFGNIPALRSLKLTLDDLMTTRNNRFSTLMTASIRGATNQATRDFIFHEIIFPRFRSYRNYKIADDYGYHLLHWATALNQAEAIDTLISINKKIDINIGTHENNHFATYLMTPLHIAVIYNHMDRVRQLLAAGANTSTLDRLGYSPLHLAAQRNRLDIIKIFIEAKVNLKHRTLGQLFHNAVEIAATHDHAEIVYALITAGAPIRSAINLAARNNALNTMRMLIEENYPINPNGFGVTPLYVAVLNGQSEMVNLLIDAKANVDAGNEKTRPLDTAILCNNVNIVRALVQAGANLNPTQTSKRNLHRIQKALLIHVNDKKELDIVKVIIEEKLKRYINELTNTITPHRTSSGLFSKIAHTRISNESRIDAARTLIEITNGADLRLLKGHKAIVKLTPALNALYKKIKRIHQ